MSDSDNNSNKQNDFEYVRETYYDLIEKGRNAIERMGEVAEETEHPRAFEVLATTIKTVSDVSGNLLDLHIKRNQLQTKTELEASKAEAQQLTQNNIFVGSTEDLLSKLEELDKEKVKIVANEE